MTSLILVLGLIAALGPLSIDMYLPALPRIAGSLGATQASVQLSLSAYFLGLSMGQLAYGPLADRLGRRRPLIAGLLLYVVGSAGCALAPTIESLIAFRFLQALGGCAGIVISRAIVRDLYAREQAARVFSRLMLVMGAAPIIAPLLGGFLAREAGWRSIFVTLAGVGLLTCAMTALTIQETLKARASLRTHTMLQDYRAVLGDVTFLRFALSGGFAQAGMFAYITGSPLVFIEHYGFEDNTYAWIFGANALGLIAASQFNSWLLRTRTSEWILSRALVALGVAACGLVAAGIAGGPAWTLLMPLFLYVSVLGLTFPNTAACALSGQGERAGSASALMGTIQFVIASACSALVSRLGEGSPLGMAVVIAGCAGAAGICYRLVRAQ